MRPASQLQTGIDVPTIEGFMWRCAAHVALCVLRALPECLETVRSMCTDTGVGDRRQMRTQATFGLLSRGFWPLKHTSCHVYISAA